MRAPLVAVFTLKFEVPTKAIEPIWALPMAAAAM
jgi:hypothetical protein